ncbi:DUF4395 domain-containing protein [Maribellus sediminis]|uniref:DUF4395 domain-containing protein n=1 Tax=Maribellus sediminis TaxID=2696285 RepID=UPI00143088E9|nr:DUF4395 domain-containing protein [Maribellus sediminis]
MLKQIVCPVSKDMINEQIVRLNAIIGVLLLTAGFAFDSAFFMLFLMADFFIRAFTSVKLSPVSFISHWLTNTLKLGEKRIDKAPKIFAARLGFVMLLLVNILFLTGAHTAALVVGGIFVFFAMLEFALAVCVGCIIFTYLVLPFYK